MPIRGPVVPLVGLAVLAVSAGARAGIDVEVGNGDRITGTLSPGTEVETFRIRVPKDAVVTVRAKAAKKGPALRVTLADPGAAERASDDGRAVVLRSTANASGLHAVTVASADGAATGDYALVVGWKSRTSFPVVGTLEASGDLVVPFAADAGARAKFKVRASGGPPKAVPVFADLRDPADATKPLAGSVAALPLSGDYALRVRDSGGAGGAVRGTIQVKPARRVARKLQLTAKVIGSGDPDGDAAFAVIVGPDGGEVAFPAVLPGDPGADLFGSSVLFASRSLPAGTPVVIATAAPLGRSALSEAGPTVQFGPEGLRFSQPALVTIPIDAAAAADPDSVRIYTRDAKGKVTLVDPDVPPGYTFGAGTVSFAARHFSSFRAFSTAPAAQPRIVLVTSGLGLQDVCAANDPTTGTTRNRYFIAQGQQRKVLAVQETAGTPGFATVPWVGGGTLTADGTDRLQFQFGAGVQSVATLADGTLFVATANRIHRVATGGAVTLVAGTGAQGDTGDGDDAKLATFVSIHDILVAADGTIYVADAGFGAHRLRVITPSDGFVRAYAGASTTGGGLGADGGDPATTQFFGPRGIAFAPAGGLYVTDNTRIRRIDPSAPTPVNVTVAGDPAGGQGSTGDGGAPLDALFTATQGIATFVAETGPQPDAVVVTSTDGTLRLVDFTANIVTLLAGAASQLGYDGDDVPAPSRLLSPLGVAAEPGRITFVDGTRVRQYRPR